MNGKGDISTDYSFIIKNIDEAVKAPANLLSSSTGNTVRTPRQSLDNTLSTIGANTSAKRRRISELVGVEESDEERDFTTLHGSNAEILLINQKSSSSLKLQLQIDELKIINEQLKEQLQSYKSEHNIFKDQAARQLVFLEEQNKKLKSDLDARTQKYYDEKKKCQAALRQLEQTSATNKSNAVSAVDSNDQAEVNPKASQITIDSLKPSVREQQLEKDVEQLQLLLSSKAKELAAMSNAKLELEKKTFEIEQSLILIRSDNGNTDENKSELRLLRKQCSELETFLRRKSRDLEKMVEKAKNQTMLEEELNSTLTKLNLAQETIKTYHSMEVEYHRLVEEKKTFSQLFMTALRAQSHSSTGTNLSAVPSLEEEITPSKALNIFSEIQKECIVLQSHQGDLERNLVNMRQLLLKSEAKTHELELQKTEVTLKLEKLEAKQAVLSQQAKLHESEVLSLRSLLKTFDMEFSIGKPDVSKIVKLKETMIDDLRNELDNCKRVAAESLQSKIDLMQKVDELEKLIAEANAAKKIEAEDQSANAVVDAMKAQLDELLMDYNALQEITGVDYLPHKTQVLHLAQNPSTGVKLSMPCSLPMEIIKSLKAENKELKSRSSNDQERSNCDISPNSSMSTGDAGKATTSANNAHNISTFIQNAPGPNQVADPAKLNQRLKEMFKEKISTFREAVYLLTGYKV